MKKQSEETKQKNNRIAANSFRKRIKRQEKKAEAAAKPSE